MTGLSPAMTLSAGQGIKHMLKIWGRNTSSNVQKVIWALAEMKLPFERIDVGGAFGKTKDPFYLAMNPNSLVPTLEEEEASPCGSRTRSSAISPPSIRTGRLSRPIQKSAAVRRCGW